MKKILLIGELGEIVRSVNECIMNDFQVQLCSAQIDVIKGIAGIIRPDLIIVCQIGIDELDSAIFNWAKNEMSKTPVLVITTKDSWKNISGYCENGQFDKLFRPVTGPVIVETCHKMIKNENTAKNEQNSKLNHNNEHLINSGSQPKKRERIMIIDDSPLVLRNMKSILQDKYDVFIVPSGEKALELIPSKCPDLILLDYEMPGMDGKETFESMLLDDYMKTIPVIFLTSMADKQQVYGVLKSCPAGYILKPADRSRILDEIHKVLG